MVQMAPMWWTTLYMLLIFTLMTININLFYMYQQTYSKKSTMKLSPSINWKW